MSRITKKDVQIFVNVWLMKIKNNEKTDAHKEFKTVLNCAMYGVCGKRPLISKAGVLVGML